MKIQIAVPDAPAVAGAAKIETALHKTETAGQKAGAAIEKGMKDASTAAMAASASLQQLGQSATRGFGSVAEAVKQEQDMLKSIRGDMQRHMQDVQTLDSLMRRGSISASEYAAAIAKSKAGAGIPGVPAAAAAASGADLSSIAAGVNKLNLNQIAAGANQAFELLNQKLKITDSTFGSVAGSAVKFGAMGMQVGGPWGAAIAGITGGLVDLYAHFSAADAALAKHREEEAKAAKAYWDSVEAAKAKKRIEDELAPILAEHARRATQAAEAESTLKGVMDKQPNAYRLATETMHAYELQLDKVNGKLAIKLRLDRTNPNMGGGQTPEQATEVTAVRGIRDADIAQKASGVSFGDKLVELEGRINKVKDARQDLEQLMGSGLATQDAINLAFRDYNKILKEERELLNGAAKSWADLHSSANGWNDFAGFAELSGTKIEDSLTRAKTAADDLQEAFDKGFGYETKTIELGSGDFLKAIDTLKIDKEVIAASKAGEDLVDSFKQSNEEVEKLSSVFNEQLIAGSKQFSDTLVEAANGADVSWSGFFSGLAVGLEKAIAQALILKALTGEYDGSKGAGGYGGLIGMFGGATGFDSMVGGGKGPFLPGFATGGDMLVRGAGGTDSRIAAFRVTPGESIHVRTPQQRREAEQAQGGARGVQVVYQPPDSRALLQNMAGPDHDRVVLDVLRRNPGAVQSLIPGRR